MNSKMLHQEALNAALRMDLGAFTEKVFEFLNPGMPLERNWHLEAIAHRLQLAAAGDVKRLLITMPPRSLKSLFASVSLPAFLLGQNPSARLICVSYADTLAAKFSREFRRVLDSGFYRSLFPAILVSKDTEGILETTAGGARLSTSVGAAVTGFGAGMIIIDDLINPADAFSQAARDRAWRFYRETLYSRLDSKRDGVIVVVMQRLHQDDLAGHLIDGGGWNHLNLPAIATIDEVVPLGGGRTYMRKTQELLHASREGQAELDEARRTLGSSAFEAQYQQSPISDKGNMVQRDWIQFLDVIPQRESGRVIQSWDTALKGDARADYSVCTTWLEIGGKHYLLDVFRKQMDFAELLKAAVKLYGDVRPDGLLIEDQGSGTSLIQQLRNDHGIHAIARRSKDDKVTRLSTVLPMFEAGQVVLPKESLWLAALLHELLGFPTVRHDDQVDSITQYLAWAREQATSGIFEVFWAGRNF